MISKSILKTLAYSDVFDYPLTSDEIWHFLIHNKKTSKKSIAETLASHLSSGNTVTLVKGFYCFSDRIDIIEKRIRREKESEQKLQLAKKIIAYLSLIPTVYFIGISGALSMKNSEKDDDIDLFVIAKKNTLWITRLWLVFLLEILGRRRRRFDKDVKDKICLNFLIDETALFLPEEKQDLYSAHEIVQMIPVFQRNNAYGRFMQSNKWVEKFLPNALERRTTPNCIQNDAKKWFRVVLPARHCFAQAIAGGRFVLRFSALEWLAKKFQLWYMRRHQTKEIVSDHFLAFHLLDYKNKILKAYEKRIKKYEKI